MDQQPPLSMTDTLTITLKVQQWQAVWAALHEMPFRIAAPLLQEMQKQAGAADPRSIE